MNSRGDEVSVDTPGWRCWLDIPEKMDHHEWDGDEPPEAWRADGREESTGADGQKSVRWIQEEGVSP